MKQIFTLFTMAFIAINANAQTFSENFEGTLASCWANVNTSITAANKGITQKSISFINTTNSTLATPYLDITTGSVSISFKYALSGNSLGSKTRTIQVGYQDKAGTFTPLSAIISVTSSTPVSYSLPGTLPNGVYRIVINGTADGNNENVLIDDLTVNANYHYGATPCNTAPVATNANFSTFGTATFANNITANATDANNEALTFSLVTAPTANGTFVLNPDGTFSFTPTSGFIGGPVTFTYKVTDNGYDAAVSNTATVTITYPDQAALPVHIINFTGNVVNSKANLSWSVASNEDGDHFDIEKSTDGKNFSSSAIILNTSKQGSETYSYADASLNGTTYYRLKIVNKNGSVSYSRTIVLKQNGDARENNLVITQNPVVTALNFTYTSNTTSLHTVNLYNTAGIKVYTAQMTMQKGINAASLNIDSRIVPGVYIIEVSNGADRSTSKIVKQ